MSFGIGIIGFGLIGQKRAQSLGTGQLVAIADLNAARLKHPLITPTVQTFTDWHQLLALPEVQIVIVATLHDALSEICIAAAKAGKHVFVEKPAGRNTQELIATINETKALPVKIRVGFNHRYHRAMRKAREIVQSGALGPLMFLRARYGHGGRLGYNKEWRADPARSGGGELIDQGPHLIDLSRYFLGEFTDVQGFAHTYYWDMPVDDNGFMLLKTKDQQVAFLHASCTEWKNLFSLEIYGKQGKLDISGLGGSYGIERLTHYHMRPEMGPPDTTSWEYPMADDSWSFELAEFYDDIRLNRTPEAGLQDALEALRIIEIVYKESGYL
ncbi:MAG: Gfo/Idh/MocA family oxidoreductase [Pseudomonadota bacterium]